MKVLYLDCGMGAAGDMLTAALLELIPDQEEFVRRMNEIGIPGVQVVRKRAVKSGIAGTQISVIAAGQEEEGGGQGAEQAADGQENHPDHENHTDHDHENHFGQEGHYDQKAYPGHEHHHDHDNHHDHGSYHDHVHRGLKEIDRMIGGLQIPEKVRTDVSAVYHLLADAESQVHGVPVSEIHFHEVGMLDALADITAVCLLMDLIGPEKIVVSPVHVGSGQVRCAHGILPVPAPATAAILKGVPIYGGQIAGELCTPTGAALLKYFADGFGAMPVMRPVSFGYGMGKKDFERVNCVRAVLGEAENRTESVIELCCNVDDMTAEAIGFAAERLMEAGALDVYTVPIGMKKSRPGTLICVLCREENRENMVSLLFKHTATLGVRETEMKRYCLDRQIEATATPYGEVRSKISSGYGVERRKYEYEDLARIARSREISLEEAKRLIDRCR